MLIVFILYIFCSINRISSQSVPHCMYVQNIELFNHDNSNMTSSPNYFFLIWNTAQYNLSKYSYSFTGYQMSFDKIGISFITDMSIITSTQATFIFTPIDPCEFAKIMFSVMLFSSCDDQVFLIDYNFVGDQLSIIQINVGFVFGNDTSRYTSVAYFKHIQQSSGFNIGFISLSLEPIQPGFNYQNLTIVPHQILDPAKIGYLLIVQKDVKPLIQLSETYYSFQSYSSLSASAIFSPNALDHCFMGFKYIQENYNTSFLDVYFSKLSLPYSNSTKGLIYDYSRSAENELVYFMLCLAKCPGNITVSDYSGTSLDCSACSLPNCLQCRTTTKCQNCQQGFYVESFSFCSICYNKFPNCFSCSSDNCTFCNSGYILNVGGGIQQCVECSSIVYKCQTCSFTGSNVVCDKCSLGYYGYQPCYTILNCSSVCLPCLQQCIECTNSSSCLKCKSGSPISGGCSDIKTCIRVNSNLSYLTNRCIQCQFPSLVDLNGTCNICYDGFFLMSQLCINVYGCISASRQNRTNKCLFCNNRQYFQSTPINNKCICKKGFLSVDNTCTEVCGDGMTFTFECDDGNSEGGDGCSENCTVEPSFLCSKANDQQSNCIIIKEIVMKLEKTEKINLQNQAIFTFSFQPKVTMAKFAQTNGVLFATNRSHSVVSQSFSGNTLSIWVKYSQDLQGQDANVTILLKKEKSIIPQVDIYFRMQKDGLLIFRNSEMFKKIAQVILVITFVGLTLFLVGPLVHKMAGCELMLTLQVIYLTNLQNKMLSQGLTSLYKFGPSCFNFKASSNNYSHILSKGISQEFSIQNMEESIVTMLTLLVGAISGYILYHIARNRVELKKKLFRHFCWDFIGFWVSNLVFSLSVGLSLTELLLITTSIQQTQSIWIKKSVMIIYITTAIFYFRDRFQKPERKQPSAFSELQESSKPYYIPLFLDFTLFTALVFAITFNNVELQKQLILIALLGLFTMVVILIPPYKSCLDNFGVLTNFFVMLGFLSWFYARKNASKLRSSQNEELVLISLIGSALLSILVTTVRLIKSARQLYLLRSANYQKPKAAQSLDTQDLVVLQNTKGFNQPNRSQQLKYKVMIMTQDIPMRFFQEKKEKILKQESLLKNQLLKKIIEKKQKHKKYIPQQLDQ